MYTQGSVVSTSTREYVQYVDDQYESQHVHMANASAT
jgi:hypothetical protein